MVKAAWGVQAGEQNDTQWIGRYHGDSPISSLRDVAATLPDGRWPHPGGTGRACAPERAHHRRPRARRQPYAPLLGALRRHIRHASPAQQRTELAGCAWLVRLLPELAGGSITPLPAWTLPPEQERRLMVDAVIRFLANVAGPAGTLLVLDDLQWAGPDALDLLTALVHAAAEVPLRVIGAYRDTEVQPQDPLAVTLADLAH